MTFSPQTEPPIGDLSHVIAHSACDLEDPSGRLEEAINREPMPPAPGLVRFATFKGNASRQAKQFAGHCRPRTIGVRAVILYHPT